MSPRILIMRPPTNPFLQALYFVVGAVILVVAVLMSAVLLSVVIGAALVLGLVIWVRVWWLRRKLARSGTGTSVRRERRAGQSSSEIIDVEYTVVERRDDDSRRD